MNGLQAGPGGLRMTNKESTREKRKEPGLDRLYLKLIRLIAIT